MKLNRRQFLLLTAGLTAGCATAGIPDTTTIKTVTAGPVGKFAADGVYSDFRNQGFFIIRHGDKLFALSAICTHRKCKLNLQNDHSFLCPCHGSTFDAAGHVTEGPARRDLPILPSHTNEQGQLVVSIY
jgi:Rieske Fe-S protein